VFTMGICVVTPFVGTCRWIPAFRRNTLPPSSWLSSPSTSPYGISAQSNMKFTTVTTRNLVFFCGAKENFTWSRYLSRGTLISEMTAYRLEGQDSIPGRRRHLSLCHQFVRIGCGIHRASYTAGTGSSFPGDKWLELKCYHSLPSAFLHVTVPPRP
jgi:hypothetical protein